MSSEKTTIVIEGQRLFEREKERLESEGWLPCSFVRSIPNKAPILSKDGWRNEPTDFIFSQDFVRFDSKNTIENKTSMEKPG